MSKEKTYNGWSNYETWACVLWIDNTRGMRAQILDVVEETLNDDTIEYKNAHMQDYIKDYVSTCMIEPFENDIKGLASDLLSSAFSSINWWEIAKSFIEDYKENLAYEEAEDE